MRDVFVEQYECVTSLGNSLDESWENLLQGKSGLERIRHFDVSAIAFKKACISQSLHESAGPSLVWEMTERCLKRLAPVPSDTSVIWTGIKGNAEFIEQAYPAGMPHLPSHFTKKTSDFFDLDQEGLEVNAACASSTVGIALAAEMIRSGEKAHVLVCGADIVSRFVHMGFAALKALSAEGPRPFDRHRDGLVLGDGAFAILLGNGSAGRVARITGWGLSNDANHITGPARDGCGLVEAIEETLSVSGRKPEDVQAFCAHGTSTVYSDAMELTAIERVFGKRALPVFSVKGALGHSLGAAGGVETAVCIQALKDKRVPPTLGVVDVEARAAGRVSDNTRKFPGGPVLTSNSGFGGVNAAILLEV